MTEAKTTAVWIESILETELSLIPLMVGVDDDSAEIGGMDAAARIIAVRIDALTAERDDARAEAERFKTHNLHLVKTIDSNRAEDGERIAKLERLRPAAEAWEAMEAYRRACVAWDAGRLKPVEFAEEQVKFNAAAARARAAKESQP